MVEEPRSVKFDLVAIVQLKEIYDYIRQDSLKNAQKVRNDIFSACMALAKYPQKYPPDKLKVENDGTYRAFIKHNVRISYHAMETEIRILRIRHSSREPLEY